MFPWPSFGSFNFKQAETAHFGTDVGWIPTPTFIRQKTLGSLSDSILFTTQGSDERTFEVTFDPDRYAELLALIGTVANFTDWTRPVPDSRQAMLMLLTPMEFQIAVRRENGYTYRKIRTRISLVST